MKEETQIKILVFTIIVLSCIYLVLFAQSIKIVVLQTEEILKLEDTLNMKEIEIDNYKEIIHREKYDIKEN